MATNINTILSWFKTRSKPTQEQFHSTWLSFWHKDEKIPQSSISDLTTTLAAKTDQTKFEAHITDNSAHATTFEKKLDKGDYNGTAEHLKNDIDAVEQNLLENYYDINTIKDDFAAKLDKGTYKGTAQNLFDTIPNLNASNLKLEGYSNNRNDGQLPTNKVLTTDESGNLKLCMITTFPAPYMEVLIPDSTLPDTTTNFTIKGAFFTPNMTVSIVGQTINYINFISDNLIKVNVTTGKMEGLFDVTLNNGISATFKNALSIVLGVPYYPVTSDWEIVSVPIAIDNNEVSTVTFNSEGVAKLLYELKKEENFSLRFRIRPTPTGNSSQYKYCMYLYDAVTLEEKYSFNIAHGANQFQVMTPSFSNFYLGENKAFWSNHFFELRYTDGLMYMYINGILFKTFTSSTLANNLYLTLKVGQIDFFEIKYIKLL